MRVGLKNREFIKVKDGMKCCYGGNQAWFDKRLARNSACASVAAANILLYMGIWGAGKTSLTKNDYRNYMSEVYYYLHPINISYPRGGLDLFYKFTSIFGLNDLSLGVPTVSRFIMGVDALARDRQVDLEARVYPESVFKSWSIVGAMDFIARGLEKDRPVALLNAFNRSLKNLEYTLSNGHISRSDFERHWVVITEMEVDRDGRGVYIYVSSWGERVRLNLYDVLKGGVFTSMVYFH